MNIFDTEIMTQEYQATRSNPYEGHPLDCLTVPNKYDFPVIKEKTSEILKEGYSTGNNDYSVVREDTKHIFAYVKNTHKIVRSTEIMEGMRTVIQESELDLNGMTCRFDFRNSGAELHARITFPKTTIEPRVGDIIRYGIVLGTSINRTIAFFHRTHACRLVCLNGMTNATDTYATFHKHTTSLDLEKEAQKLSNGIEAFFESTGTYQLWMNTFVSHIDTHQLFKTTLARKYVGGMPKTKIGELDTLMFEWRKGGSTLWDIYNVATAWATHLHGHQDRGGWKPSTQNTRHGSVSSMLRSDMWKELENA